MKAVVFHGVGDIRLDDVPDPKIKEPTDAIVKMVAAAICGTDLHMVRGSVPGMQPGTVLGHEGVGVIEAVGSEVRNLKRGDRVVIASTIACGYCSYCRSGYYSQCDNANPQGRDAGTAYFGGPTDSGPFDGLQAEWARIPFAHVGAVKLPEEVTDDQALLVSDIFPTGYFGAKLAEIKYGDIVAVFGCGPIGQFAIASAKLLGAGRVIAIDCVPSRLDMAKSQGAEVVNFNDEDPVEAIKAMTGGIGADRAIDAVGVDAIMPRSGPAAKHVASQREHFAQELEEVAPQRHPEGENWMPGNAPSLALLWAAKSLAKAGTLAVIGVYPESARVFPIGIAMNKNFSVQMGNCNHRKYIPRLLELVRSGAVDPSDILTQVQPISSAIEAYKAFDLHRPGWMKVELEPTLVEV